MKFISSLKSVTFIFWIYWFFSIIRTYALSFDQVSDTTDQLHLSKIITSESLNFIPWRFDREGDTILLSFWDSCFFFFWANLSVQNQGAFWILSTIAVETVKKQGSETSESWFFGSFQIFFIFKIFGIFGNLKIDFSINVSKCFPTIVNSFRVMLLFS